MEQQIICLNRALLHGEIVRAHDVQEHLRELVLMLRLLLSLSLLLETRDITTILQVQESTGSSLVDRRKSVPEKSKTERKRKFENSRAQDEFQDVRLEGECFCRIAMTTTKEGRKEEQDAADLQSFSQTNTAAAADWLKSQIAHFA